MVLVLSIQAIVSACRYRLLDCKIFTAFNISVDVLAVIPLGTIESVTPTVPLVNILVITEKSLAISAAVLDDTPVDVVTLDTID